MPASVCVCVPVCVWEGGGDACLPLCVPASVCVRVCVSASVGVCGVVRVHGVCVSVCVYVCVVVSVPDGCHFQAVTCSSPPSHFLPFVISKQNYPEDNATLVYKTRSYMRIFFLAGLHITIVNVLTL